MANVYVQDLIDRYLTELRARLERQGFDGRLYVMLSSGGVATVETASRFPTRLLESGPAAGALAAATYGRVSGHPDLVSFDMGGTTAKLCVVEEGRPLVADEFYLVPFLRRYAEFLERDPTTTVSRFLSEAARGEEASLATSRKRLPMIPTVWMLVVGGAALAAAALAWSVLG